MPQVVTCPPAHCKTILSSACVFYEGPTLLNTGINTNDSVEVVIQKIDDWLLANVPTGGGGGGTDTFEQSVFQIAHGFVVGDAIRNANGVWVKAQANTLANSGTVGVVSDVFDTNNFTYQFGGHLSGGGPWTEGESYFLSTTTPGAIVLEEMYDDGEVREFIGTGTAQGLLLEIDLGDLWTTGVITDGGGGAINLVTDYRSSFEVSDGKVYAGYLLNGSPVINRTIDGVLEVAQNLTNLETDWTNRLSLTYV